MVDLMPDLMTNPGIRPVILFFVFLAGLSVGSFLNVVALRFLADQEIINKPSHCPKCQAPIAPVDNIPVVSYVLLGGRCRHCKEPISIQYPLTELATGVLFVVMVAFFGVSLQTLFWLFFISNLIVIFITDWRESLIFQINSLSLIPAGLLMNLFNLAHLPGSTTVDLGMLTVAIPDAFISALIGIVISVVFFEGMILISNAVFGTEGFGHGDTHLMMGVGAFLGWQRMALALVLGFLIQLIPAVPILVVQWVREKRWVSLISGAVSVVTAITPLAFVLNPHLLEGKTSLLNAIELGCIGTSLVALFVFLKNIKSSQSFTYLPLGPALVLGSLVALLWGRDAVGFLHLVFVQMAARG